MTDDERAAHPVAPVSSRVLTVPNLLTAARIALVPVFLVALLAHHDETMACWVLVVSALTDWLDGVLARRWRQVTRLGMVLDPIADRLFVVSTLGGLLVAGVVPWWLVVLVLARDAWGVVELVRLRRYGLRSLPVTFIGKAATVCLLYAFPLLLLAHGHGFVSRVARPAGWAFAWWGLGLYWLSGIMYFIQAQQVVRRVVREES